MRVLMFLFSLDLSQNNLSLISDFVSLYSHARVDVCRVFFKGNKKA